MTNINNAVPPVHFLKPVRKAAPPGIVEKTAMARPDMDDRKSKPKPGGETSSLIVDGVDSESLFAAVATLEQRDHPAVDGAENVISPLEFNAPEITVTPLANTPSNQVK